MSKLLIILILVFSLDCFGQNDINFIIKEFIKNDTLPIRHRSHSRVPKESIFEDETFVVSKTCSGEWGGTIKFRNKKTNVEYSAASTCPVVLNKLNGKYYVTNTLAHLRGSSEILEIDNPDSMTVFKLPEPRGKKGKKIFRYVGDDESKSTKGTKQLVDSVGVLTLASFPYNGQLYHIITDFEKTFLAKIQSNKFLTIGIVSSESLWTYNPEVFIAEDKHFISFFNNQKIKGHLDIFGNQITVIRKK